MELNEKYNNLVDFWNSVFDMSSEDKLKIKNEIKDDDYKDFAPSKKLFDAVTLLGKKNKVLDYGCGSGWASIISAKSGANDVTSVDPAPKAIEALNFYRDLFGVSDKINAITIDKDWLKQEEDNKYDGLVSSNVLDVIPFDLTKEIIKEFARITKKDALVIIGLNFYLDEEKAKARGMNLENDELYVNGVLRLLNKKDEEWIDLFSEYFNLEKLEYFAWAGEEKETRRLFYFVRK